MNCWGKKSVTGDLAYDSAQILAVLLKIYSAFGTIQFQSADLAYAICENVSQHAHIRDLICVTETS